MTRTESDEPVLSGQAGDDRTLTGIEQLRAMMAAGVQPPIGAMMEFDLVSVDEGRAVFAGHPTERVYNPIGSVHGGYAAALLDSACGCAVHSLLTENQAHTTLELKVSYLRAMTTETGPVRAEATVVKMGGRAAFAEARLTDAQGRLLATATSTLLVFAR
ncbi:hypothetical protein BH09ACT6_BH09ACT6_17560 [soil metagenome]